MLPAVCNSQFMEQFGLPDNNVKGYPLGRIGDVVSDVHYGTSAKASDNGKYVYIRMNNITYEGALDLSDIKRIDVADSEIENYIVRYGDVLFNRTNSRDLVGKTCVFDRKNPMIIAGYIIRLRMNGLVLPEYLSLFMNTRYAKKLLFSMAKGAVGQANINAKELQDISIIIPPIDEQREFLTLVRQSDKSQFIEMFGDPVKNPFGWPTMTLDQATKEIVSGQCLNGDAGKLQPGQKAVLKVSAVTYGSFDANEYKVLRDTKQITKGIYPQKGDLLFSRANTREYVGATVLIDQDYPELMLPDKLWKLIFKHEIMPMFAKQFLSHPEIRKVLSSMATGTSGSMYNISMEKLKRLEIIVPNINQQKEYIHFVEQSDKSKLLISRLEEFTLMDYRGHGKM